MLYIVIGIGNGLQNDMPSRISAAVCDKSFEIYRWLSRRHENVVWMVAGGYIVGERTEADAMVKYSQMQYSCSPGIKDPHSYRTHNNAYEGLQIVDRYAKEHNEALVQVIVVDHPKHLPRTMLSFRTACRLYHEDRLSIQSKNCIEEYDGNIPGQAYWATKESFAAHEKKSMLLYRFLLFRPWARFGFWVLRTVWPSSKQ